MQALSDFLDTTGESLAGVVSYMMGQYPKAVGVLNVDILNVRMSEALHLARSALDADARMALPTTMAYKVLDDFVYESPTGTLLRKSIATSMLFAGETPRPPQRPRVCDEAQANVESVMRFLPVEKYDLVHFREYWELMETASRLAYCFLGDGADCRVARTAYFTALCWNDWRSEETRAWMAQYWPG